MSERISLCGEEQDEELLQQLDQAMKERLVNGGPPLDIPVNGDAQLLKNANSETEYLDHLVRLIRKRDSLVTVDFDPPRKKGVAGRVAACIKRIMWRMFRYQHDYMSLQQNSINTTHAALLEYEHERIKELERRIETLEKKHLKDVL